MTIAERTRGQRHAGIVLGVLTLIVIAVGACALGDGGRARALREEARDVMRQGDIEAAFETLKQLATSHPDAPETREAFLEACELSRFLYFKHRVADPRSRWTTTELDFMFSWLARYYGEGEPPEVETNSLFGGFTGDVFRRFQDHARSDPRLAGWVFRAKDDNGVIQSVSAVRSEAPPR
jgi:hypothetical protein